jgi:hypothetical protein
MTVHANGRQLRPIQQNGRKRLVSGCDWLCPKLPKQLTPEVIPELLRPVKGTSAGALVKSCRTILNSTALLITDDMAVNIPGVIRVSECRSCRCTTTGVAPSASRELAAPCRIEWNPSRGIFNASRSGCSCLTSLKFFVADETPERIFERRWALSLLDRSLRNCGRSS